MHTTTRSIVSFSLGFGLTALTITSALLAGVAAPVTTLSFGLLTVYGLLEIAWVSYETPRSLADRPAAAASAPTPATLVPFPRTTREVLARAA